MYSQDGPSPRPPWLLAVIGAWIGALVVLTAWVLAVELTDRGWTFASILLAHAESPLFWFVDLTPLYLATLGWVLGQNERLEHRVRRLETRLQDEPTWERPSPLRAEDPTADLAARDDETTLERPIEAPMSLAHFAHELRTPLNAVIGYGEMVCEELREEGRTTLADDAEKVVRAGRHLVALVDDVLDLSRMDANRLPVQIRAVSARAVAEETLDTVAPLAEQRRNALRQEIPNLHVEVRGDGVRIRQILLNLLGNACKFTEDGTVTLRVEEGPEGFVTFSVRDTGVGMTEMELARLFREYAQAHDAVYEEYGGTGLGLVISRRLAQLMGGRITVESVPGEGSTFALILPLAGGGRAPLVSAALTLEQRVIALPGARGAVALLVHPEPRVRELLARALGGAGFQVEVAHDAAGGLDQARVTPPSLAVVHARLPDLSGAELVCALKERRGGARLPVILLGGPAGVAAGQVTEVLEAPVDPRRLEQIARRYRRVEGARSVLLVQRAGPRRDALRDGLVRDGLDVEAVADGVKALREWRGDAIDLVVLSLVTDGDTRVLEQLSAEPRWRAVPVLAFASSTLVGLDLLGLDAQVDRFVVCGSEEWDEVVSAVRDGVGALLAAP